MAEIRALREGDRDALYEVCLKTGNAGRDASGDFEHPDLLGDVFVGPYLALQPELTSVVDAGVGAAGYLVGTDDTRSFDARCRKEWWPLMRERYRGVKGDDGSSDAWLLRWIASPPAPPEVADAYPAHLHIDLLPSCQGGGWGRHLIERFADAVRAQGARGVHLGVGRDNVNAAGFYRHLGFEPVAEDENTYWLAMLL